MIPDCRFLGEPIYLGICNVLVFLEMRVFTASRENHVKYVPKATAGLVLCVVPARMLLRGVQNERRSYTKHAPRLARILFLSLLCSKPSRSCFLDAPATKYTRFEHPAGLEIRALACAPR